MLFNFEFSTYGNCNSFISICTQTKKMSLLVIIGGTDSERHIVARLLKEGLAPYKEYTILSIDNYSKNIVASMHHIDESINTVFDSQPTLLSSDTFQSTNRLMWLERFNIRERKDNYGLSKFLDIYDKTIILAGCRNVLEAEYLIKCDAIFICIGKNNLLPEKHFCITIDISHPGLDILRRHILLFTLPLLFQVLLK
jgi:hypothetical protein